MSQAHTEECLVNDASHHQSVVRCDTSDRDVESRAPVLDPALLAHVHQLNLDYLELLIAERDAGSRAIQLLQLPLRQRTSLAALSPRALRALAEMPYTLYSLGFEAEKFWEAVCANATSPVPASAAHRFGPVGDGSALQSLCELTLLHASHVAATNTMAARVVYAMPYTVAKRLAKMPLWHFRHIAASYGELMMPRWPTNPAFWPDLIRFAANNDVRRLQTTRLLGVQLIAAELEVACEISRRYPRLAPALASPRLRSRKSQLSPSVPSSRKASVHEESK